MRNFDNWTCYRDLKGNILRGCVQFNVKGGNTPAPIYDRNGTAISNPQITDILGRTQHQVFIDEDVTAYFYKYVGNGTIAEEEAQGIDTSDVSRWALQYTCDNVLSLGSSLESLSPMEICTMSGLRALDPESVPNVGGGVKEIILGGYYEAGDCEQVRYIWDEDSTEADDNGSIIKSNDLLTGRWILSRPDGFVDSRHFGVFPQYSQFADIDHTTRIMQLVSYCNSAGLNPLFGGSVSHPYFIYNSLYVNSRNAISVSKGTAFVDKSYSNFYGDWDGDPLFVNCLTKVSADLVKASWNFSDAITYNEVWLDGPCQKTTFKNARVIVTVDTSNKVFEHCELVSDGHLGENTFRDCVLRGSMFVGGSISPTIDDQCTIQPLDFVGRMPLWCVLRSQKHDPIVDVCMQTLDASCSITLTGIWFKNALFDSFTYTAGVNVGFEGCRGSLEITFADNTVVTCEDSELNFSNVSTGEAGVGYQPAFRITGGAINFVNTLTYLVSLVARDTSFQGPGVLVNGDAALNNVALNMPFTVRGALSLTNCQISTEIHHYAVTQVPTVRMIGCTLNNYYRLVPAVANSTVNAVWTNNYSPIDAPILIDRTNLDPIDSHHTYVYSGNSGGFLPYVTEPVLHSFTIRHVQLGFNPSTQPYELTQTIQGSTASDNDFNWFGKIWPYYTDANFDTVQMFRIGTDSFRVDARMVDVPSIMYSVGSNYEYAMNKPRTAELMAHFVDGYTFGIRPLPDPDSSTPGTPGSAGSAYLVSPYFFQGSRTYGQNPPTVADYTVPMKITYECMDKHGR